MVNKEEYIIDVLDAVIGLTVTSRNRNSR